ncbi:MAG: DegV family protein [Chloroflexi bacterium]|nr:DegV family protein [Chloroflexota bacterium]MCL5274174.1 DegV family protein [Chloroflexota bacterium]
MVKIVTDSTCDLSKQQVEQFGLAAVARLYVRFGKKTYQDGVTIDNGQFYTMLKTNPNFPSTSQPSVGDFAHIYQTLKGEPIVSIHVSRDLSGTIASAEAARDMAGGDITIIDSRNVNAGLALLVITAAAMAQQGATAPQIKTEIESLVPRTRLIFVVETLENLRRGGRIGAAQAFLGGMLQFKPIIAVKGGHLEPVERVRTMAKAVTRLKEIAVQDLGGASERQVAFMHANAPSAAEGLMVACSQQLKLKEPVIIEAGPVVATHSGPGAVGLAYIV